jgi:hypothetical protein
MSIWSKFVKFIVKTFWPWFKEFVWPFVKEHVVEIINWIITVFKNKIKEKVNEQSAKRENDANKKAEEAEQKADQSSNTGDAEKYKAVAQVWREVAEQFRADNEELRKKLDDLEAEAQAASKDIVENTDFDIDFSGKQPILKIGEVKIDLPALPE